VSVKATIQTLVAKLFEAEKRRLNQIIVTLNQQNKLLKEAQADGFMFGGQFYLPTTGSLMVAGPGQAKTFLHKNLHEPMDLYLKDHKLTKDDEFYISQTLVKLLIPCRSLQDIRDALPECLVACLPELAKLSRRNEPGFTIQEDERALRQYEKILPKMQVYSAARMLY
jgi:hypothetical protein